MRMLHLKVFRDLKRMWALALAISLVTAAGAAIYVLSMGTVQSLEDTRAAYYDRYRFTHIFALMRRAPDSVAAEVAQIPGVQQVATRITYNVVLELPDFSEPVNGLMTSAPPEDGLNLLHLRRGRRLMSTDTDAVIVSETFARAHHLDPGDTFQATIKGRQHTMRVVGTALSPEYVFFSVPGAMIPDNERFGVIWMNHKALQSAFGFEGAFNSLALTTMAGASEQDIMTRLDILLAKYGCSGSYSRKDHTSHATLTGQIEQLRKSTRIAAPVFLAIVAFMLHMMMKRHIATERELIGMLKAFGFSNAVITWHYAALMLLIVGTGTTLGVILGVVAGRSVTGVYAHQFQFPFLEYHLSHKVLLQAALVQLAAGALGTLSSLTAAARIEPAVAMRPAPPPIYRRTALERFITRLAGDQIVRIIFRNIIRWPLRSAMGVVTVMGAMALIISPLAVMDSAAEMSKVHFFQAERQDITVAFAYPRDVMSLHSMSNYPGVLQIEPFRVTPVRLKFGQHDRRVVVIGHSSHTELSHPIDLDGRPIDMPSIGLVMSESLAAYLGAHVGDKVNLTMLETNSGNVDVPITAISRSYIGMTFFYVSMEKHNLNRLLKEGDLMSGAHVKIDPSQQDNFYTSVKNTPSITAVVSHVSSLATLRRMTGEQLKMTYVNFAFATMILVGVIYNTGRISLWERQRELATLIMLGFSRAEAAFIIIGEMFVLGLLSMPFGCLAGYALSWELTEGAASEAFRIPLHLDVANFGYGILSVTVAMIVTAAALYRYMAKLDLIEMMKTRE
jgi:putative ABC transport system permease protein